MATFAALVNAPETLASGPIDLDVPDNLLAIQRDRPDHFAKIQRILAEAPRHALSADSVATWMRTEFKAQDILLSDLIRTSLPPKKRLNFSLDTTSYTKIITLAGPEGSVREAIQAYAQAARSVDCQAAKRLVQIYENGDAGVSPYLAEAAKWFNAARMLGCDVPARRRW